MRLLTAEPRICVAARQPGWSRYNVPRECVSNDSALAVNREAVVAADRLPRSDEVAARIGFAVLGYGFATADDAAALQPICNRLGLAVSRFTRLG